MNKNNDFELSLAKLFFAVWKHFVVILLVAAAVFAAAYLSSRTPVVQTWNGKASFFLSSNSTRTETENFTAANGAGTNVPGPASDSSAELDLSSAISSTTSLSFTSVDTLCYLATSPKVLEAVITRADLPYSVSDLSRMVSTKQDNTKVFAFSVSVRSDEEDEALLIAQAFADTLPGIVLEYNPSAIISVLDDGSVAATSSGGADLKKAVLYAGVAAVLLVCLIALVYIIKEYTGRSSLYSSDLKRLYPDQKILGLLSSAQDADAIRRLRSNMLLALPEKAGCRMIGITAATSTPAKDESLVALAKSLAALGGRVLLVDADFSSHRLGDLLQSHSDKGLNELIRKAVNKDTAVRPLEIDGKAFSFLPTGNYTDAASELLTAGKILPVLQDLQADFDYILVDFAPVDSSIDAASVWSAFDGMIVYLCEENCTRNQLSECMAQLEYASAKFLGFALLKNKYAYWPIKLGAAAAGKGK